MAKSLNIHDNESVSTGTGGLSNNGNSTDTTTDKKLNVGTSDSSQSSSGSSSGSSANASSSTTSKQTSINGFLKQQEAEYEARRKADEAARAAKETAKQRAEREALEAAIKASGLSNTKINFDEDIPLEEEEDYEFTNRFTRKDDRNHSYRGATVSSFEPYSEDEIQAENQSANQLKAKPKPRTKPRRNVATGSQQGAKPTSKEKPQQNQAKPSKPQPKPAQNQEEVSKAIPQAQSRYGVTPDGKIVDMATKVVGDNIAEVLDQLNDDYFRSDNESQDEYEDFASDIVDEVLEESQTEEPGNTQPEEPEEKEEPKEEEPKEEKNSEAQEQKENSSSYDIPFDIDFEDTDIPQTMDSYEKRVKKWASYRDKVNANLARGIFDVPQQEKDKATNKVKYTNKEMRESLLNFIEYFNVDKKDYPTIFESIQNFAGLSTDSNGATWWGGKEKDPAKIQDWDCIWALNQMVSNTEKYGYPFLFNDKNHTIANTTAYVVPFASGRVIDMFINSGKLSPEYNTEATFTQKALDEWRTRIYPHILQHEKDNERNAYQKVVLENMALAAYGLADIDKAVEQLGINHPYNMYINEAMKDHANMEGVTSEDVIRSEKINNKKLETYARHFQKKPGTGVRDKTGALTNAKDMVSNPLESGVKLLIAAERLSRVARPELILNGVLEKGKGTFIQFCSIEAIFKRKGAEEFVPTFDTSDFASNKEMQSILAGYASISASLGSDLLAMFAEKKELPTEENIKKFVAEESSNIKDPYAKSKLTRFSESVLGGTAKAFSGDWSFRRSDFNRFIADYMSKQFENKRYGLPYVTAKQLEDNLKRDPKRAMLDIMADNAGRSAFHLMRQRSTAGNTLLSEGLARALSNHGITQFGIGCFFGQWFPVFGVRITEQLIPFLNTAELIVMRSKAKSHIQNEGLLPEAPGENATQEEIDAYKQTRERIIHDELLSMNHSELLRSTDFKDALTMDVTKFVVSGVAMSLAMAGIFLLLGVEPPDKEEYSCSPWEWKIGGVPLKESWWMIDLTGWAGVVGLTAAIALSNNTDFNTTSKLFLNGTYDLFGNYFPLELMRFLINPEHELVEAQKLIGYDEELSTDKLAEVFPSLLGIKIVENAIPNIPLVDMFVRGDISGGYSPDANSNLVYTPTTTDDPTATTTTTAIDALWRKAGAKNIALGAFLDLVTGAWFSDGQYQKTGYMAFEQPLDLISDEIQLSSYYEYNLDLYNDEEFSDSLIPADELEDHIDLPDGYNSVDEYIQDKADKVLDMLQTYSVEELAGNGVVLAYPIRHYVDSVLTAQINALYNEFDAMKATSGFFDYNGKSYNENQELRNQVNQKVQEQVSYLYDLKDKLWDDTIPYKTTKYYRTKTDWVDYFVDEEGNQRTGFEYDIDNSWINKLLGNESGISNEIYPYGNVREPITPAYSQVVDLGTYNDYTPLAWVNEYTSPDLLEKFHSGVTIPTGRWEGQDAYDLATQDGKVLESADWSNIVVLPLRGYRALDETVDYDAMKEYKTSTDDEDLWTGAQGNSGKANSSANSTNSQTMLVSSSSADVPTSYSSSDDFEDIIGIADIIDLDNLLIGDEAESTYSKWGGSSGYSSSGYYKTYTKYSGSSSSYGSSYNPRIYSVAKSITADKAANMYTQRPYSTTTSYLRPSFYTKGSREAYKRSDI